MNEDHEDAEATGAQSVNVGNRNKLLDNSDTVEIPIDTSADSGETTYKDGDQHLEAGGSLKRASGTSDEIDTAPSKKRTLGRRNAKRNRIEGNKRNAFFLGIESFSIQ
jgi:hypothetical protein